MQSDARLWREIDRICAGRDVVPADENASTKFRKGNNAGRVAPEIVLNVEWSEAYNVGILDWLAHTVDRTRFQFVLECSATELDEAESPARSGVKDGCIARPAGYAVPGLGEKLDFSAAVGDLLCAKIAAKQD